MYFEMLNTGDGSMIEGEEGHCDTSCSDIPDELLYFNGDLH